MASSSSDCPPPAKRAPIAELFGDLFPVVQASSKPLSQVVDEEVQHYRAVLMSNCSILLVFQVI